MRYSGYGKGHTRIMPLLFLPLLASAIMLLAACGGDSGEVQKQVKPEATLLGSTPFPTALGIVGGCEIGPRAECPGADFSNQELGEQPVGWRQLDTVGRLAIDFTKANLRGAKFIGSNLEGAEFEGADLREANFHLTNLTNAIFFGADASGADFTLATMQSAEFKGANLSGADFSGALMKGGDFSDANFTGAILHDVSLVGAFLSDADLSGADLTGANLSFADLDGAILEGAIFCNTKMTDGKVNNEDCP